MGEEENGNQKSVATPEENVKWGQGISVLLAFLFEHENVLSMVMFTQTNFISHLPLPRFLFITQTFKCIFLGILQN